MGKHPDPEAYFAARLTAEVSSAVRYLLESKHLYQTNSIDVDRLIEAGKSDLDPRISGEVKHFSRWAQNWQWTVIQSPSVKALPNLSGSSLRSSVDWRPLDMKAFCNSCDRVEPFNWTSAIDVLNRWSDGSLISGPHGIQVFCIAYTCQGCKGAPEVFLVRRQNLKLILCGRAPMEATQVSPAIPKTIRRYYSDGLVAFQSGQVLAGLFLLRTLCEQWARHVTGKAEYADVVIDAYMALLPNDFKERFPSLKDIYTRLSAALHAADDSPELFETVVAELQEHFEARRLYKLSP